MLRLAARLSVVLLASLATACGGGGGAGSADATDDAREVLASVRPIESATTAVRLRIKLENAPPDVGSAPLDLTLEGPLRSNGPGKLPSFDWIVGFSGFGEQLSSRLVSTGSNLFVRLGGQDFEVGADAVARATRQAGGGPGGAAASTGLAALGVDPLAAVERVNKAAAGTVAGAKTTRYTGTLSTGKIADQVVGLLDTVRVQQPSGGAQVVPSLDLTPERRRDLERAFASPSFTVDIAEDRTLRRIVVATRFTTPEANRAAAGGTTGGTIEYRAEYSEVGKTVAVSPPADAEPIADFVTALQQLMAQRDGG